MMKPESLVELVTSGNTATVETEWMEVMQAPETSPETLVQYHVVLAALSKQGQESQAEVLAWSANEALSARLSPADRDLRCDQTAENQNGCNCGAPQSGGSAVQRHLRLAVGTQPEGNAFSAPAGGVCCPACRSGVRGGPLSGPAFKLLRFLQTAPYADAAPVRIAAALGRELEQHLRGAVEVALDQEVRAARFVEVVRTTPARASQRAAVPTGPDRGTEGDD